MTNSLAMQKAAAWVNYQVEREGIARLTILILVLTTVGMLSFTWGYAEGVHNSQTDLAEEIRLPAPAKLPSIAELRHSTDAQQHAVPVPLPTQSDSTPLPADESKTLPATGSSNLTGSSDSQQQQQQQQVPAGTDTAEQAKAASDSSSSEGASSSSADGDVGLGSISSGISKVASSILQSHSRAGDGSEDELTAAATQADESDSQLDHYGG